MAWNDEELTGRRQELLSRVRQRGEQLRQRRRLAYGLSVPALLLLVAVPAALALSRPDGNRTMVAADGAGRATTTVAPPVISLTPLPATESPTTSGPSTSLTPPPTTAASRMTTTSDQRVGPTSSLPATTVPPTSTTTTTLSMCDRAQLAMTATSTDKGSYAPGETVNARVTLTNTSSRPCWFDSGTRSIRVQNATGADVYGIGVSVLYAEHPPVIQPGEKSEAGMTWDQKVMEGNTQAPPGLYTVRLTVGGIESQPATLQLVAS